MSSSIIKPVVLTEDFQHNINAWLIKYTEEYNLHYLLAHADDGVIWGCIEQGELLTSHQVAPKILPQLRISTLQQCRLFSQHGELLLWSDETRHTWLARMVTDGDNADYFDEDQLLWGNQVVKVINKFSLLREAGQGFLHAVPVVVSQEVLATSRLSLRVRHYIDYNQDGEAYILVSRLIDIRITVREKL